MKQLNQKTLLFSAIRKALFVSATASVCFSYPSFAAEEKPEERKMTITGSAVKRTDIEGSLPITYIDQEAIVSSGVTSVTDLIAQLPEMQGFTTAAQSVGGGGGGQQTASLRDLGSQYTLVLLNGRRMAAMNSGSSIDLNSIPLATIERVEILTDGASALYGSDAIAGVVNFILKKDLDETTLHVRSNKPQKSGGESSNFSISSGMVGDGYNILFSFSHDQQTQLKSSQRDFAKTGLINFNYQGNDLIWQRTSANAIPANAYLQFGGVEPNRNFNPYREANGQCAPNNAPSGSTCIYDFTETLEIFPESTRDNLFVRGEVELNNDLRLFSSLSYSQFEMVSRIAPYPTGTFTLPLDSQIVQENIIPHLSQSEADNLSRVAVRWRARPGGNRTNEYSTDTANFTLGLEGELDNISYDIAATYADSEQNNTRLTGYPIQVPFLNLLSSGAVNIFDTPENLSAEQNKLVKDTMYSGPWNKINTQTTALEGKFSMPVFEMTGGEAYIAAGFDYRRSEYVQTTSQANKDAIILFEAPTPEFDLSRDTYGFFTELVLPITDELEVTGSVRYDNVGKITDSRRAAGMTTVNKNVDDTTYKVSLAYRPTEDWLLRASIGTGFKAPSMRQIASPRIEAGVTSSGYACPFEANDPRAQGCLPGIIQYNVYTEGYDKLKAETSEQASVGFVYSSNKNFSFHIDWWQVNLEDQVQQVTANQIFADPVTYADLFTTRTDPGTGDEVLAIIQAPINIGKSNNQGVDWGFSLFNEFSFGQLKTSVNGTYFIESESLVVGTEDEYQTSMGRFGNNNAVTFRNIIRVGNTLTQENFTHRLNMNYRSGYKDQYHPGGSTRIRLANDISTNYSGGVQLYVSSYATFDYSTSYDFSQSFNVTFGINNLFDRKPPLTLRTGGSGHQVGFDPRYTDVFGRTFYLSADYTF